MRLSPALWLGALALPLTAGDCGGDAAHCPSETATVGIKCTDGNVPAGYANADLQLHLTVSAALLQSTQQLVLVLRAKPIDGSDVCADLWTPDFAKTSQGATLLTKEANGSFSGGKLVSPQPDGDYGALIYALDTKSDLLCETDAWCGTGTCVGVIGAVKACAPMALAPIAGGCSVQPIVHGMTNSVSVTLAPKP